MNNSSRNILLCLSLFAASVASGAGMPTMDVTVSNPGGNLVYKGKTNASGTFATSQLPPGKYVVQFNSSSGASGNYALIVSAGKQKVMAEAVPGSKFAKGGVAMNVEVGKGLNITGQVSSGKAGGAMAANSGSTKVKIVNGKRYFWAGPETGSNLGGRWVEEGSPEAATLHRMSTQSVQESQERGMQGAAPGR